MAKISLDKYNPTQLNYRITLRSVFGAPLLQTRRVRNDLARCSFGVAVPAVWNALPSALIDLPPRLILSRLDWSLICLGSYFTICCDRVSFTICCDATMLTSLSTVSTTRRCIAQETFCEFVRVRNVTIIIIIYYTHAIPAIQWAPNWNISS